MDQIKTVLTKYQKVAVVGISPDPGRPSHDVASYLIEHGFDVVGVRPGEKQVLGRPCYPSLADVPGPLEIVDVFRAPEHVPAIVEEAIRLKAKVLWLQEGVTHASAGEKAKKAGLVVISNRCMLKEHSRLFS